MPKKRLEACGEAEAALSVRSYPPPTPANSPSLITTKVPVALATTSPSDARRAVPSISTSFRFRAVWRPSRSSFSPSRAG